MVDIYRSRRKNFHRCLYYKRNEIGVLDNEELIHSLEPKGVFYATIVNNKEKGKDNIAGVFRVPFTSITILTEDKIDLETDDIVLMDGKKYIVERIAESPIEKNVEFGKNASSVKFITIRGK